MHVGDLGEGGGVEGPFGEAEGTCVRGEGGEEGREVGRGGEVVDALGGGWLGSFVTGRGGREGYGCEGGEGTRRWG